MSGTGFAARLLTRAACVGCLVGFAASAAYAIEPQPGSAPNASECLSRPKGAAPQGERWYYRVERTTKRHCWYTRAAAATRVAAPKPPRPETIVSSNLPEATPEPLLPTVAEARAEADITPAPLQKPSAAPGPREAPSDTETNRLTGTLANRWPGHQPADPVAPPAAKVASPEIGPAPPRAAPDLMSAEVDNDGLWIVVGLAGIAAALAALGIPWLVSLLRRRRQLHMSSWDAAEIRNWHEPPLHHPRAEWHRSEAPDAAIPRELSRPAV